jgi:hypothetical protein
MLVAGKLCLCDREAAYSILEDLGEIEADLPHPPELALDFRIGSMFEEFVAQAMAHAGVLRKYQTRLTDGTRKGRLDMETDPLAGDLPWQIEVKTAKTKIVKYLRLDKPSVWNVAQAEVYAELSPYPVQPVLFYASRDTFASELYCWEWKDDDCWPRRWVNGGWAWHGKDPVLDIYKELPAGEAIQRSKQAQEAWLGGGDLPPRCGDTPDQHPFKCVEKYGPRSNKRARPKCKYYGCCWETSDYKTFPVGAWPGAAPVDDGAPLW